MAYYIGIENKSEEQDRCIHNDGVQCTANQCRKCGWNPRVEKDRKARIREAREGGNA